VWLLAACAGLLAGCSDDSPEQRSYDVPDTLCDLEMAPGLYDRLFPPGEEVAVEGGIGGTYQENTCRISVDGEQASFLEAWMTGGVDVLSATYDRSTASSPEEVPGRYEAKIWDGLAIASARCTLELDGAQDDIDYSLVIQVDNPAGPESRATLRDLIQPAMEAAVRNFSCVDAESSR
jgi:hypothetical protein